MADTDRLQPYVPKTYPKIETGVPKFTSDELNRIAQALRQVREVLMLLEARIEVLEP